MAIKAGVYHEEVKFKGKCGTRSGACSTYWENDNTQYITLEAFGDERVILDGTVEVQGLPARRGQAEPVRSALRL